MNYEWLNNMYVIMRTGTGINSQLIFGRVLTFFENFFTLEKACYLEFSNGQILATKIPGEVVYIQLPHVSEIIECEQEVIDSILKNFPQ